MDIESGIRNGLDTKTKLQVANNVRKGRKIFLGCLKGEKTDKSVTWAPNSLVDLIAFAGFGVAAITMIMSGALIVDITGGFLLFFAPYLAYQKRILNQLGTFRSIHNKLRSKVNELMVQNDLLTQNVDRLEGSVSELEQVENELAKIAKTDNVDRLIYIVSENKRINEQMRKNTEAQIVQQLITTVLRTDRDLDLKIGPIELKNLMLRLDQQPGFDFHRDRFLKALGKVDEPVPIEKIMGVIHNLKDTNVAEKDRIFSINTNTGGSSSSSPKRRL